MCNKWYCKEFYNNFIGIYMLSFFYLSIALFFKKVLKKYIKFRLIVLAFFLYKSVVLLILIFLFYLYFVHYSILWATLTLLIDYVFFNYSLFCSPFPTKNQHDTSWLMATDFSAMILSLYVNFWIISPDVVLRNYGGVQRVLRKHKNGSK